MNKIARDNLKKFYKERRAENSEVSGKRINAIIQGLHAQYKAPADKRDPKLIKESLEEIAKIREENAFKLDFPDFPSFKKYFKENKLSLKDFEENS